MKEKQNFWHSNMLAWLTFAAYLIVMALVTALITVRLSPDKTLEQQAVQYLVAAIGSISGLIGTALGIVILVAILFGVSRWLKQDMSFGEMFRIYMISRLPDVFCRLVLIVLIIFLLPAKSIHIGNILILLGEVGALLYFYRLNTAEEKLTPKANGILSSILFLMIVLPVISSLF